MAEEGSESRVESRESRVADLRLHHEVGEARAGDAGERRGLWELQWFD